MKRFRQMKSLSATTDGTEDKYKLIKFTRSNQGTCVNQRPIVSHGESVEKDDIIADGPSTKNGEIGLDVIFSLDL